MCSFDITKCREQFPALTRTVNGEPAVFVDGPAGSQVPACVAEAVRDYLLKRNANHGGAFATSRESDALLEEAHRAVADFVGTDDPDCVVFGPNMTTLTFALSRSLGATWSPGDEVIVTKLDHDANYTPWVLAARDVGATVHHCGINPADCTLDLGDLSDKLSRRTKLVAVCGASNAVGTVTPIDQIVRMSHEVGAKVFLDAVHFAPHRRMKFDAWGCDFAACSPYKFFGPHVGVMVGKRQWLEELDAYKVRPAPDDLPGKWMTGTQNHEGIAGTLAAIDYLAGLSGQTSPSDPAGKNRQEALDATFTTIGAYEAGLTERVLEIVGTVPGVTIWGVTDRAKLERRVPTFSITHEKLRPAALAARLGEQGIFTWSGNYYALPLTTALGLEPEGMVRVGLLHYNTTEEIDRLAEVLSGI